jgi:hypothetical protein
VYRYTDEEVRRLAKYIPGRSVAETTERFNLRFGMGLTEAQIKGFMANRRVRTGRSVPANKGVKGLRRSAATEFTKGRRPWNWRPARSVRVLRGKVRL